MWNACRKGPGICLNNSNPCTEDETSIVVITTHQAQGNPENKKCILSIPDAEQAYTGY